MCGHTFVPAPFHRFTFLISSVSHPNFLFTPDSRYGSCDWPSFRRFVFLFHLFLDVFFFALCYQVFELKQQEASDEITKLENEVFDLQERLQEEARFDISLITGSGRGRPKSDAFVAHVRCLLATGLLSLLYFLLFSLLSPLLSFHLSFCPDCSYMLFVDVCVCKRV